MVIYGILFGDMHPTDLSNQTLVATFSILP